MVARDIYGGVRFEMEFDELDLHEIVDSYNEASSSYEFEIVHEPMPNGSDFFHLYEHNELTGLGFFLGDLVNACILWVLENPEHFATFVDVGNRVWSNGYNMDSRLARGIIDTMVTEIL